MANEISQYGMFSAAGNRAVQELIDGIVSRHEDRKHTLSALIRGMSAIKKRHPEVSDTAVRESIAGKIFSRLGFEFSTMDLLV